MMVTPEQVTHARDLLHLSIPDPHIARELGISEAHVYAIRLCHDLTTEHVAEMLFYVADNMDSPAVYAWSERVHTATPLRVFMFPGDERPTEAQIRAQVPKEHRWRRVDYIYVADDADALLKRRRMRTNMVAFATESADSSIDGSNIKQLPSRRELAVEAWRAEIERIPEITAENLLAATMGHLGQIGDKTLEEFQAAADELGRKHGIARVMLVQFRIFKFARAGGVNMDVIPFNEHTSHVDSDVAGTPEVYAVDAGKYRFAMRYISIPKEFW